MNGKERCLAAIQGRPVDRTPVFPLLMFFAADRFGATYREFAANGHVLAQAQLKARETFDLDAITVCSDAFRVSADLGGEMVYPEDKTPYLAAPLVRSEADLARAAAARERLGKPEGGAAGRMADRVRALEELLRSAGEECLVLGWIEMPFAEACNLCGVSEFLMMTYENPILAHQVLEFATDLNVDFARRQLDAGAPMIGAGDAAASLLSPRLFREFALPYERRVCSAIRDAGGLVKLHICGDTTALLDGMVQSGADLFNVDHLVDFRLARKTYGGAGKCFKGNIDPVADMLMASPQVCAERCRECLRLAEGASYMLSAGCEVPAGVADEVFRAFCNAPMQYNPSRSRAAGIETSSRPH